jgi:hypothetical protein
LFDFLFFVFFFGEVEEWGDEETRHFS